MKIKTGNKFPEFHLSDSDGNTFDFASDNPPVKRVIYFYPKADTPGCTKEACAFRDSFEDFTDAGADVIGISGDSPKKLKDFKSKHKLPFTLLSDEGNKLRKQLGLPSTLGIIPGRITFILDEKNTILHIFNSQLQFEKHISQALKFL